MGVGRENKTITTGYRHASIPENRTGTVLSYVRNATYSTIRCFSLSSPELHSEPPAFFLSPTERREQKLEALTMNFWRRRLSSMVSLPPTQDIQRSLPGRSMMPLPRLTAIVAWRIRMEIQMNFPRRGSCSRQRRTTTPATSPTNNDKQRRTPIK